MNILPEPYSFLPRFLKLALVNALSYMMIPLAGVISVAFLGHLPDIKHLAGVALAAILFDYLYGAFGFLRLGTNALTAQAAGRDDQTEIFLTGMRNALIALALGLLVLLFQYPLREIGFAILSATPDVKTAGINYFNTRILGAPAVLLNYVLIGWFLGQEKNGKVLLLTVIGNSANIIQDYIYINCWNWSSAGAGLSQAFSQYLTFLIGMALVVFELLSQGVDITNQDAWKISDFQAAFKFNANLLWRFLVIASTFAVFNSLGAIIGIDILATNALLLQLVMFSLFIGNGVGYATTTLSGNFKGQQTKHLFLPLLQIGIGTNLLLGLFLALTVFFFPNPVFKILTNHTDLIELAKIYVPWLLLAVGYGAITLTLEGYLTGLAEAKIIRNAFLISSVLGFAPFTLLAWYYRNNHILWLALSMFTLVRGIILAIQIPKTLENNNTIQSSPTLQTDD